MAFLIAKDVRHEVLNMDLNIFRQVKEVMKLLLDDVEQINVLIGICRKVPVIAFNLVSDIAD